MDAGRDSEQLRFLFTVHKRSKCLMVRFEVSTAANDLKTAKNITSTPRYIVQRRAIFARGKIAPLHTIFVHADTRLNIPIASSKKHFKIQALSSLSEPSKSKERK
jgi:hypothetical protein